MSVPGTCPVAQTPMTMNCSVKSRKGELMTKLYAQR